MKKNLFSTSFSDGHPNTVSKDDSRTGPGKDPYHGRSYHKYFEGYTEYPVTDSKGNVKIVRVYTAPYFRPDLPSQKYSLLKCLYFCLAAVSTGIYLSAMLMNIPSNYSRIVALMEALSIGALFFFFIFLASYIFAKTAMTIRKYRSIQTMLTFAKLAAILRIAVACIVLIFVFLVPDGYRASEFFCALLMILSAVPLYSICIIERKIVYKETANDTKVNHPDALLIERLH